jgi:cytochrome c1
MQFNEVSSLSIRTVNAEEDAEAAAESWYLRYMEDEASLNNSTFGTWLVLFVVLVIFWYLRGRNTDERGSGAL